MSNMMTVKLDNSNYIIWKHQISMVMETYSMIDLLDEASRVPEKFLKDHSGAVTAVLNPDFLVWKSKEKALLTFISSTLTPSVLAITVGCSSALELWKVLENRFSSFSRSHVMNLKGELHNVKKGSESVDTYLQKIKVISDKLMAVGIFLDDEELLHVAIKGLPREFSAFRSAIRTRSTRLSFDELTTMLNAEEESMNEGLEIKDSTFAMAVNTAPKPNNYGSYNNYNQSTNRGRGRNQSYRGRGRGFSPNNFSQGSGPRTERPTCQICGKAGHIALDCYHRMDYAYQGKHPPTKLAAMATSSNSMMAQEQPWLADSAATDHVTSSLNHLNFPKPYNGQDHLTVGNGQSLPITHIGNTLIPSSNSDIQLRNVLRVPNIASNLASVHKICHDNQCWCYFDENTLSIQALATGKVLYKGKSEGGVYPIYPHKAPNLSFPHKTCNSVSTTPTSWLLWHNRLGHPNSQVLKFLFQHKGSPFNKCTNFVDSCVHCLHGKMHKLPFPSSRFVASAPFELVHTDLWGPAPLTSINGFQYYVIFVDHYTRFTWLYLLHHKSEVYSKFVQFHAMIQTQISATLKTHRSDGGGEYTSKPFESYLSTHGIHH